MTDSRPDLRLVVPALAVWVSAGIGVGTLETVLPVAYVGFLLAGVLLAVRATRRRGALLVIAALACCGASVGLTAVAAGTPVRRPAMLVEAAEAGRHLHLRVVTTETVVLPAPGSADAAPPGAGVRSYDVEVERVLVGDQAARVSVPALVVGRPPPGDVPVGTTLELEATVAATVPGDATAFLIFPTDEPETAAPPAPLLSWAGDLRAGLRSVAAGLPGDGGVLLPGLAVGDTSGLTDDLDGAMKASSLTHLTAVSGANCAIVVGLVMLAGAALGLPRAARVAAAAVVLVAFVVLVTPEPSVLRAAVMALLVLAALAGGRPIRGVPVLCVAVIALLVVDPWLSREYGFVLSVLATGGLLLLAGPVTRLLAQWVPAPLAAAVAVPVAAQLACQPVLILLVPAIPTYGVPANLLAGPAAPVATVLGLVACLLLAVVPPLGVGVAWLAWLPAAWIAGVARYFGGLPGGSIPWADGVAGVLLLSALTGLGLSAALGKGLPARARRAATLLTALGLVSWAGIVAGSTARSIVTRPDDWVYGLCEVGQGDAGLVRSEGRVALIDTGPEEEPVRRCLDRLGIDRLDLLVLTHFDLDHIGGAAAVVGRVDRVLAGPPDGSEAVALLDAFARGGARVEQVAAGATGSIGGIAWEVLWPLPPPRVVEPGNDASVVMLFDDDPRCAGGCRTDTPRALFLGDLGAEAQARLLGAGRISRVDVVKVAHHGSADQHRRLYETLSAPVGLIGVGEDNDYGHPAPALVDLLEGSRTVVARTDTDGLVLVAPDAGRGVRIWRER